MSRRVLPSLGGGGSIFPLTGLGAAAARYAQTTRQTVTRWHHGTEAGAAGMPERAPREALSYFQLIEVAVVAAFRREGVSLKAVRTARDYAAQQFECEFPFAQLEFARAGRELLLNLEDVSRGDEEGAIVASKWGQRAWEEQGVGGALSSRV